MRPLALLLAVAGVARSDAPDKEAAAELDRVAGWMAGSFSSAD